MGKTQQKTIPYSGWNTNIFDGDTKIDRLLDSQGSSGFLVYFYLCQKAYGTDGYFYQWCLSDCATTARRIGCSGISAATVQETVGYCIQIGLFDQRLFDLWGVLSSKGIQRSYWRVLKERRVKTVYEEYWLLDDSECEGLVKISLKSNMSPTNSNMSPTNDHMSAISKEKISKDNNIVATPKEPATKKIEPLVIFFDTASFEMCCVDKIIKSCIEQFPNSKVPDNVGKQKWCADIEKMKRLDNRTEKEIMTALNYAITDSFWKSNIRSTRKFREKFETLFIQSKGKKTVTPNKFNNFQSRDVDFDELAAGLIRN